MPGGSLSFSHLLGLLLSLQISPFLSRPRFARPPSPRGRGYGVHPISVRQTKMTFIDIITDFSGKVKQICPQHSTMCVKRKEKFRRHTVRRITQCVCSILIREKRRKSGKIITKEVTPMWIPVLYTDPQTAPGIPCPRCRRETYGPGFHCPRCERRRP